MLSPSQVQDLAGLYRLVDKSGELTAAAIAESEIEPLFLERYDAGALAFFEPLRQALPSCYRVIEGSAINSCLVVDDGMPGVVIIWGAFELNGRLLVASSTLDWMQGEPEWHDAIACLPPPLRCFHAAHFNGLHTSRQPGLGMATSLAKNLPGAIFKWDNVEVYRCDHRLPHRKFEAMKRALGDLQSIRIWIDSEWGDLILLNQNVKDQRLYHVRGHDFETFTTLADPVGTIDRYCAHVLAGHEAPFEWHRP